MKLTLIRKWASDESTIGELYVDGRWECYTLEDTVRDGAKVYGQTAIPAGTYKVKVTYSPRFKKKMPLVMGVPGFEGIRIHPGNKADDTEGCILVGQSKSKDWVGQSRMAYEALYRKIDGQKDVEIEIKDL